MNVNWNTEARELPTNNRLATEARQELQRFNQEITYCMKTKMLPGVCTVNELFYTFLMIKRVFKDDRGSITYKNY